MTGQHRCSRSKIRDQVILDDDRGVADNGVCAIHGEHEFQVLDQQPHGCSHRQERLPVRMQGTYRLENLEQIIRVRHI